MRAAGSSLELLCSGEVKNEPTNPAIFYICAHVHYATSDSDVETFIHGQYRYGFVSRVVEDSSRSVQGEGGDQAARLIRTCALGGGSCKKDATVPDLRGTLRDARRIRLDRSGEF